MVSHFHLFHSLYREAESEQGREFRREVVMAIATPKRKVTMGRRDGQIEIEHGGGGGDVCTAGERVNAASG